MGEIVTDQWNDHVAKAMTLRNNITPEDMGDPETRDWLATAQVHATLALVEQQRVANLIALFAIDNKDAADFATVGFSYPAALVEITEGLGLS